jgi:effector-binding domain-containing protein
MPRYHVQRSIQINAPSARVFDAIADYRTWTTWSPWLCAEPGAKVNVSANPSSVGSIYSWQGEIVGQGEIEHRRLQPGRLVEDELRFIKPFRSRSEAAFEMAPDGEGTRLTWHMRGSLPWFLFWMRPQMEIFIGMDFERGLKMLKEWIETGQILSKTTIRGVNSVGPMQIAGVRKTCTLRDIGPSMDAAFAEARQKLPAHNLPADGEPVSVYHKFDMKTQSFDYTSGFSLPKGSHSVPTELSSWSIPAMQALCVEHTGSYNHLGNAWSAAHQVARCKKLKQGKVGMFEIYKNDPNQVSPADLRTEIFLPLK